MLFLIFPIISRQTKEWLQLYIPYNYNNFYLLSIYYVPGNLLDVLYTLPCQDTSKHYVHYTDEEIEGEKG